MNRNSLGVALSSGGSAGAERSEGSRSEPESSGAAAEAGAVSTSAARPDPEVVAKAKRRTFTAEYKQRILQEADRAAATPGGVGALLRRQGLYSSHLVTWRRERSQGIQEALAPRKRGRKSQRNPLEEENQKLRRQNARLTEDLRTRQWLLDLIGGRDTLERLQSQLPDATDLRFLFSQLKHGRIFPQQLSREVFCSGPRHFLVFLCLYVRIRLGRLNFFVGSNPVPQPQVCFQLVPHIVANENKKCTLCSFHHLLEGGAEFLEDSGCRVATRNTRD
jgi:transposase-like protein